MQHWVKIQDSNTDCDAAWDKIAKFHQHKIMWNNVIIIWIQREVIQSAQNYYIVWLSNKLGKLFFKKLVLDY